MATTSNDKMDASPRAGLESGSSSTLLEKDVAIGLVGEHAQEIDPVVEACVLRKIDLFLIPAMTIGYGLVYYDKALLGSAALFGMTTDLSLTTLDTRTSPQPPTPPASPGQPPSSTSAC
ncbi:hypothetical protein GQ44DRAFT_777144 [Phaeosphaeriaceae sp. PMI808]|nr:hypothetical protein GQ44DRAFT_777144 [Phaeosphaeriaceae sp. PMI808]